MMNKIELSAAEQLLETGVRMEMRTPFFLRWLGWKSVSLRVYSLKEGTLLRISRLWLSTGLSVDMLKEISHEQALALHAVHGYTVAQMVATGWLNGYLAGRFFTKPLARYMQWHCTPKEIYTVAQMVLIFGGVRDFMTTTRSIGLLKVMEPRLGQKTQGS